MQHSKISSRQGGNERRNSILWIEMRLASGEERLIKVEAQGPSKVVVMVYNNLGITDPTRTPSTTKRVTCIGSATAATIGGMLRMIPTTFQASR